MQTRELGWIVTDAWNTGRVESELAPLLAEDLILHGPRPDGVEGFAGVTFGRAAFLAELSQLRLAFGPDAVLSIISSAHEDDRLHVMYHLEGVHVAPYLGIQPTGRSVSLIVQDVYRVFDDHIVEAWHSPERFTLIDDLTTPEVSESTAEELSAELVTLFPPGAFPESLVAHPDGDIYVTLQFDGRIIRVRDGQAETFFQLPGEALTGNLAGVVTINVDAAGRLVAVIMSEHRDYQGVWAFDVEDGQGSRIASIAQAHNHLNGSAIDDSGRIYVADSNLGLIWRITEGDSEASIWCRDSELARRDFVGLAPGINGLRYHEGRLIATNSDRATVLGIPIMADGSAGVVQAIATGVPGDDFAIDHDGSLYVTTHVHDSVVLVRPDGVVAGTVATGATGVVGPTSAIIAADRTGDEWLYVVSDGGLVKGPGAGPLKPNLTRFRLDPSRFGSVPSHAADAPRLGASPPQLAEFRRYLDAFSAGDIPVFTSYYTDDILFELSSVPPLLGRQAVADFYTTMYDFVREGVTIRNLLANDRVIVADITARFTAVIDAPDFDLGPMRAGESIQIPGGVVFYELRDGLICRINVFQRGGVTRTT